MRITPLLDHYDYDKIAAILRKVPLFEWMMQANPKQFPQILKYGRLFRFRPGELVIGKGEISQWIYIVLQGGCFAYVDEQDQTPINHLKQFDLFGEIAAILNEPRSANIVANYDQAETFLLGMDFAIFSKAHESAIDIGLKVLMYEAVQRTVFKRLRSVYRDLASNYKMDEAIPPMEFPPEYLSPPEQLLVFTENCREGALALQKYSAILAEKLNKNKLTE